MRNINSLSILLITTLFLGCSSNNDVVAEPTSVTFNFSHSWEDAEVTSADFNDLKFVNENGETLSITRLRYVISDIVFTKCLDSFIKLCAYGSLLTTLQNIFLVCVYSKVRRHVNGRGKMDVL